MFPRLLELGPVSIYTYGVLLATAYLVGLWFATVRARARGLDANRVTDLGIYIIISALVGAKLLLVVVEFDHFRQDPSEIWTILRSGGVFYGGLLLAVGVAFWYVRRHRLPLWTTCDAFAPGIALGQAVGRIGCLMAGCCYGKPTELPWGITFTHQLAATNVGTPLDVSLHPTQLYESAAVLVILGILLWRERQGPAFPGRTFWSYLLLYPLARFGIEFFRGDPRGTVFEVFSTSQFVSLMLIPLSLVMLFWLRRSWKPEPTQTAARARAT
jgi:phosphatidylglycerol:prolipoprotein diacylglycerol transferase